VAELVLRAGGTPPGAQVDPLGGDHEGIPSGPGRRTDPLEQFRLIVRLLRNERHVGPRRESRRQRDPARVAAHDLEDDRPVVARGGVPQPLDRVDGDRDGGMEAEGPVGAGDVVVHRLRDADDPATAAGEFSRRRERIVPSDGDQHIDPVGRESLDDLLGVPLLGERVRSGAAEYGPALADQRAYFVGGERAGEPVPDPLPAVQVPDRRVPLLVGAEDHGPDRGVKPGAIAPTRKDPELHAETSRYPRGAVVRNS
jgi:hypothetical protein